MSADMFSERRDGAGHAEPRLIASGSLRIASYNVHRCIGTDGRCDPARVARVIGELRCDTLGLQEVDNRAGPGHDSMQLDFLADVSGMRGVPGMTIVRHDGHYGNALLTRRPVLDIRQHDLSYGRGREPRGALDVDLDVDGAVVRVVVTHLGLTARERAFQVERLLRVLEDGPREVPLVLLGDINEWRAGGDNLRRLHTALGYSPSRGTFPVWLPWLALDRIWVRPGGALRELHVHRSATARMASDHYPIRALVAVTEDGALAAEVRRVT